MNEQYYLVTPIGTLFHSIEKDEINNLERMAWISYCPTCGCIESFHTNEKDAKENSHICSKCYLMNNFKIKHKSHDYKRVKFKYLIKGIREINGCKVPYMELKN